MAKAERALVEARLLLREKATEGACNRAYYAMHDAAHAALLATGHETPDAMIKTHHGLIAAFGKDLVLSGRLDAAFGRALNAVRDVRQLADYGRDPPPFVEAEWAVAQAEAFVAAVHGMLTQPES
jgi:uncharacterized protein (UPF0332 family)